MTEVGGEDVVRLMLQFCRENELWDSLRSLVKETGVSLNGVSNIDLFMNDIMEGHWQRVLSVICSMELAESTLTMLYEQILYELLEANEKALAQEFLTSSIPLSSLQHDHVNKYNKLHKLCYHSQAFNASECYEMGTTKMSSRRNIANEIRKQTQDAPQCQLLALLGDAMKYQQLHPKENITDSSGQTSSARKRSLFVGNEREDEEDGSRNNQDCVISKIALNVPFGDDDMPESVSFSNDNVSFVCGGMDGLLEIRDYRNGEIRDDLPYQANDEFMKHDKGILATCFNRDGSLLASGCREGCIKVWTIGNGECIRKFPLAHGQGITCLQFGAQKEENHILSCSFDGMIKIFGLVSGTLLKQFSGHSSYVNCVTYSEDYSMIYSGSSDKTVKIWNITTKECTSTLSFDTDVHSVIVNGNGNDNDGSREANLIVGTKSTFIYYVNTVKGQIFNRFEIVENSISKGGHKDILFIARSNGGRYIYAYAESGTLYIFNTEENLVESSRQMTTKNPLGVIHHKSRNVIITYANDASLQVWKV